MLAIDASGLVAAILADADAFATLVTAVTGMMSPVEDLSPYLTVREAANHLRCQPQRIYDLQSAGRLSRVKEGRRTLVRRSELDGLVGSGSTD